MRLARFRHRGRTKVGKIEKGTINEIRGGLFGNHALNGTSYRLDEVKLLSPVVPNQMFGPGLNFIDHLAHASGITGQNTMADDPRPWHKGTNGIIGPEEPIIIPYDSYGGVQHEGECLAVIGHPTKRVSPDQGWSHILGYTCGNDVSERGWQKADRSFWRAKGADTFSPIGPWIDTDFDPRQGSDMIVRLNGRETQRANTKDMYFDFGTLISHISQWVTLRPGDIIWSGTTGDPEDMRPGDVVEVEISGIGILKNPIIAEPIG